MDVQMPDGTIIRGVPDGTTKAQLQAKYEAHTGSSLEAGLRGAANAATFGLGDTIAAAGDATIPLDSGSSNAPTWTQRFQENRTAQRGHTGATETAHPIASVAGGLAGGFINPATRALPVIHGFGVAALQGAGVGAAYGAGGAVSNGEDLSGITGDAITGAATGGMLGTALHGAGNIIRGATRNPDAVTLNAVGIPTTIGQDLGGGFKRAEDAATSMPWGGDAIIARQKEGLGGFNRALENNALSPVGLQVPTALAPGNDAGRYLKTMNDAAYKAAYTGATVQKTPQLVADLQAATDHFPAGLDSSGVQKDIQARVLGAFDQNGIMDTKSFNAAKNWLSEHSRTTQSMSNDQIDVANAYKSALSALKGQMSQTDPQRGAMLKAADAVYARRLPLIDAAGNTNASMKGGIVTPAQYSRALDSSDGSAHGLQYSLGGLPQQSMVQAAQRTLPSSIPDSGTAIRRLISGGLPAAIGAGVGAGAVGLPGVAAAGLPMLATRLLYSKKGQDLAKAAFFGNPTARATLAQIAQAAGPSAFGLLGPAAQNAP